MADQIYQEYLAHRVSYGPHSKLGCDYLFGFDTGNDYDTLYLESLIQDGYVPEEDLAELRSVSLTMGYEQLINALSCAYTMRENSSFNNPLDGQDPLTFLYKVLHCPNSSSEESDKGFKLDQGRNDAVVNTSVDTKPKGQKRKRNKTYGEADLEGPFKKHGKYEESPFWSAGPRAAQSDNDEKPFKTGRKDEKMAKGAAGAGDSKYSTSFAQSSATAFGGDRSEDNVLLPTGVAQGRGYHEQESVSGGIILRTSTPPLASQAEKPSEESRRPAAACTVFQTRSDAEKSEKHEKTLLELESDTLHPSSLAQSQTPKRYRSSYFDTIPTPSPTNTKSPRPPRGTISSIPFPRLDAPQFGLIQEELSSDPFRLLIAVTFLIRVKGKHAIPVFRELMDKYPTPSDLADADTSDIVATIRHLGLATIRATAIQKYARIWTANPPRADVRYGVKNYPVLGDGADIRAGEALGPEDSRSAAWEIGHMTQGRYAIDSWRIFCRDVLLGRAQDWRGKGREGEFQPEWMRVLPQDKELRACLRWLWMQEGWAWDPRTGEKEVLPDNLRRAVDEGRVAYDDEGELKILDKEDTV
ncbi:DNA glycosylase [Hypoxylon cercidicola]|nr:DNA glycosylase [Hypoxylon cercidicola]